MIEDVWSLHQLFTSNPYCLHAKEIGVFTRKAVILKESKGQHPTQNHSFKTMTPFNTDYNNTELLDQELTTAEISQVSGGMQQVQLPYEVGQSEPDIISETLYCEDGLH